MFLLESLVPGLLSDVDDFRAGAGFFEQMQINQAIMKHNLSFAKACESTHGNQVGISRPGANDEDSPQMRHSVFPFVDCALSRLPLTRAHAIVNHLPQEALCARGVVLLQAPYDIRIQNPVMKRLTVMLPLYAAPDFRPRFGKKLCEQRILRADDSRNLAA